MNVWPHMNRLERELTSVAVGAVLVAGAVGVAIGWAAWAAAQRLGLGKD